MHADYTNILKLWQTGNTPLMGPEDAREIMHNVLGFFRTLESWHKQDTAKQLHETGLVVKIRFRNQEGGQQWLNGKVIDISSKLRRSGGKPCFTPVYQAPSSKTKVSRSRRR